jgi:hypothetical protein
MLTELQGQIERITFTNEENGFTMAKVKIPGRQELVCAVGNLTANCKRNLIYTGITPGRKLVVMVGTRKDLAIAVKNNKTQKRYTRLTQRLIGSRAKPK